MVIGHTMGEYESCDRVLTGSTGVVGEWQNVLRLKSQCFADNDLSEVTGQQVLRWSFRCLFATKLRT